MSKTIIKVSVNDQALALVTRPVIASGGKNENVIQFYFDESWQGYTKTAVFSTDEIKPIPVVVTGFECVVPPEVTAKDGIFYFGVIGSGENTKTTELLAFEVEKGAVISGDDPLIPTPDIYSQILNIAVDAKNIAQGVREEFDNGVVPALRDQNTGAAFSVWSGPLEKYIDEKDDFPDGMLSIIDDQFAEYLVSQTDAVTKYSGGTAESVFRVTSPNVPVNIVEGSLYASPAFSITFPDYITAEPYSCSVSIVKTGDETITALLSVSGSWDSEKTQKMKVVSPVCLDSVSVTIEVRARFKWSEG